VNDFDDGDFVPLAPPQPWSASRPKPAREGGELCPGDGQRTIVARPGEGYHICRMQTLVSLTLNGESRAFDGPVTVSGLLATLGLEMRKVAVERNAEIVPRSRYAETWLEPGDSLEIVHFIGGG